MQNPTVGFNVERHSSPAGRAAGGYEVPETNIVRPVRCNAWFGVSEQRFRLYFFSLLLTATQLPCSGRPSNLRYLCLAPGTQVLQDCRSHRRPTLFRESSE